MRLVSLMDNEEDADNDSLCMVCGVIGRPRENDQGERFCPNCGAKQLIVPHGIITRSYPPIARVLP